MATASATASNVLLSTAEKENYLRISRLLIVGGTELMRNVFDKFHPPSSLSIKLTDPATKAQLLKTLMKPQRDCVYPSSGVCGESKDFDISLLSRLLKTICPLPPVLTGWDHLPNSTDLSVTADIVRVKVYRNDISHKYHNMAISDGQFSSLWNEIKKALIRIADFINTATRRKWEKDIDQLLNDPLTPVAEKNARELYELYLKEMDAKECTERGLKNLQTELKVSSKGIEGELQNVNKEIAQRMEKGIECIEREIQGVHGRTDRIEEGVGRLEREIQDVQGSVSAQVDNSFKQLRELILRRTGSLSGEPGARLRISIEAESITGPHSQATGMATALHVQPTPSGDTIPSGPAAQGNNSVDFPTEQQVMSVIALRVFEHLNPSTTEEINRFVQLIENIKRAVIVDIDNGSLVLTVKCNSLEILEGLWEDYCTGLLGELAQKFLVTDEILEELGLVDVKLKTTISEDEYLECQNYFIKNPALTADTTAATGTTSATTSTFAATIAAAALEQEVHVKKLTAKFGSSLTTKEHTARQSQGNGGLRPPKRPGYGTVGRRINLRANFFGLNISPDLSDLYHYDVEITPNKCPRAVKRDVVNEIIRKFKATTFQGHQPAFDGEKNLYSRIKLPPAELSVTLPGEDGGRDRDFKVKIQFAASVSLLELKNFLSGKYSGKVPQEAVQALDIIMRQMPSCYYTPVGQSFFPFDVRARPLGEGCEVQFGFYSSVRHSEWKAMLLNIDVSAKGFYKSQAVIPDFLCEIFGVRPQNLEDHRFQLDKRELEKAINGIRIQTTHATIKRKYTVWGVSRDSAERLAFDIEEDVSGRKIKTTVAKYFKDTYKLRLRYPHLPCLRVGQKRDCYLPMEVCTIIPCQKRHLSEQQIANMIRSTAHPAPERQQDIQYWAQEVIQASGKYLKEEFKTSISPEMVKVDGRVLPPPKIKLGQNDQALVPRDGLWDMRGKSLHEGARIESWALACFAPSRWCNEDHLRNFCKQMASMSSGEGMRMTEQPTVVKYARGYSDVESLFSKWVVDFPRLQLIMAVMPEKTKYLYSEIKRVGDNVLGIPTQCVQSKLVQQAKPQICANISLKINSKLGGTNHVIDPTEKSLVFREPVIIFGADVTHPSPTENGIPSIAAVVASMDSNATKYHARVRAQTHEKTGGAQEIIKDLAAMVQELLIDFYRANGKLKPSKIIFYRDGVSEGQFDQVLVHEVRAVQQACVNLEKDYRPRITFVVVQKRHHTRLFCENKRDASGKAQNVPPGTTVDSGITHPYEFDFYLCSHYGIQGTSRPAHYHVLYDDNAFTADSLQQLTYQLCHVYARCTRSVSIPAPAYYAHLVAFRARHHVTNGGNGRGEETVDLEKCARAIRVNDKMKGAMYFI